MREESDRGGPSMVVDDGKGRRLLSASPTPRKYGQAALSKGGASAAEE